MTKNKVMKAEFRTNRADWEFFGVVDAPTFVAALLSKRRSRQRPLLWNPYRNIDKPSRKFYPLSKSRWHPIYQTRLKVKKKLPFSLTRVR